LASRFPVIVAAALKLRQKHFAIDGELVVLDKDGVSTRCIRASTTPRRSSMRSIC
jgi:hypothetical protein